MRPLRRAAKPALAVAIAVLVAAALLALWKLPPWLVDQAGPKLGGDELTKAVTEERRNVLAALAAIGAAFTLWYTHQRQELDRDANRTDRYTKAVEQLGDDRPSVQLGGVYALERVAKDSRRDRAVSIEVLSAFVRDETSDRADDAEPSEPVRAALEVLARRPRGYPRPNLHDAKLAGVFLPNANLIEADFARADLAGSTLLEARLGGANLHSADMRNAKLDGADLSGAVLFEANLSGGHLFHADLSGARLVRADLRGADFSEADLTRATLTNARLNDARLAYAKLAYADLSGADLSGAILAYADLSRADLSGDANLSGANLSDAKLGGAIIGIVRWDDSTTWPDGFSPPPKVRLL
jgi:Pentapeptide repeats (8 copies)